MAYRKRTDFRANQAAAPPSPAHPAPSPAACLPTCLPPLLQWPSLVRSLSPVIGEMPGMVLERYNACQVRGGGGGEDEGLLLHLPSLALHRASPPTRPLALRQLPTSAYPPAPAPTPPHPPHPLVPTTPRRRWPSAGFSPSCAAPGPPWTPRSSSGAMTAGRTCRSSMVASSRPSWRWGWPAPAQACLWRPSSTCWCSARRQRCGGGGGARGLPWRCDAGEADAAGVEARRCSAVQLCGMAVRSQHKYPPPTLPLPPSCCPPPSQIVLLGVCCSSGAAGGDEWAELALQPLPRYSVPTDGVTMVSVAATASGRIFLGGTGGCERASVCGPHRSGVGHTLWSVLLLLHPLVPSLSDVVPSCPLPLLPPSPPAPFPSCPTPPLQTATCMSFSTRRATAGAASAAERCVQLTVAAGSSLPSDDAACLPLMDKSISGKSWFLPQSQTHTSPHSLPCRSATPAACASSCPASCPLSCLGLPQVHPLLLRCRCSVRRCCNPIMTLSLAQ